MHSSARRFPPSVCWHHSQTEHSHSQPCTLLHSDTPTLAHVYTPSYTPTHFALSQLAGRPHCLVTVTPVCTCSISDFSGSRLTEESTLTPWH